MKFKTFIAALFFSAALTAQNSTAPANWFNLDQGSDSVNGVGTERVYRELLKGKKSNTVIVGVIDSGVDIDHEDLKGIIWTNEKEIAGNGVDDDKNGYIDDVHGWNFIGGKDGKNISYERLEYVRIYKKLHAKYDGKTADNSGNKKEFELYEEVKQKMESEVQKYNGQLMQYKFFYAIAKGFNDDVKKALNIEKVTAADLAKYNPDDARKKGMAKEFAPYIEDAGSMDAFLEELNAGVEYMETRLKYNLNPDFDPRPEIVGDNVDDPYEKNYGNNDVKGTDATHGTHVAGIIAAMRNNSLGIDGIADNVKIMPIRAVPNGDERDKDIANAIYYAVDNGCQIVNMSFGKAYVVHSEALEKAIKYAEKKGVLLVHAAGNESTNIDVHPNYPTKKISRKGCKTWIEVGALSWKRGEELPANFSNYGKKSVDVFAPGVDIYSTVPGSKYKKESGTSMACPATAGVAAVLKSYFPQLSAKEIKMIIEKTANVSKKNAEINLPAPMGTQPAKGKFSDLSRTGGYVNLYDAVKMAMKMTGVKL